MLAALPDPEIEQVLAANADVIATKYPMISEADLRHGVAETRAKGFSLNPGLILANSWGVGVAIRNPDGSVAGALSIAAIDSRMRPERQPELAGVLREEVDRIEARIGEMMASRTPSRAEPDQRKALRRANR